MFFSGTRGEFCQRTADKLRDRTAFFYKQDVAGIYTGNFQHGLYELVHAF